jgi:hypothetical protein
MKNTLFTCFLAATLTACNPVSTLTQGWQQSREVAVDLEQSVGSKPFVGFNWRNGVLASVTINFQGVPKQKSLAEIVDLARASVKSHFKQQPAQIQVSFAIASQ